LDDYRFGEKRGLVEGLLDDDGDIDDEDELVREFVSSAAESWGCGKSARNAWFDPTTLLLPRW
jgi:hypothetical protein